MSTKSLQQAKSSLQSLIESLWIFSAFSVLVETDVIAPAAFSKCVLCARKRESIIIPK